MPAYLTVPVINVIKILRAKIV